ncbi:MULTISPECIES: Rha family transcriptional regulator [Sporosarcina]|uniref:Rha family phage regulatory protein n=1 Tax=Sporosarcina psychrophila TaxID=1476 RepID=A0ABV2KAI1_SPOPS|nr:Rha family transcriptional regulator [Sporosarcina sp. resist]QNK89398.1 Rha family transcriptional regulator [Sporosarcina sp. resist]
MNNLKVVSINGQLVTDSREVARMVDREHNALMKSIRSYVEYLGQGGFAHTEFFIESEYEDTQMKKRPSFLITKKGCDMVANKMTGEKGVLFTAAYVTRFEELEKAANAPKVLSSSEQLRASMRLSLETSEDVEILKEDVAELKDKVENQITLDHGEQRGLQRAVARKVYDLEKHQQLRPKLFRELYREIKDRFGVASYKDVKRQDLQAAIGYVNAWIPRRVA